MAKRPSSPKRSATVRAPRVSAAASPTNATGSTPGLGYSAYDAAVDSPNRSSFVAFPTNSRRELTPQTRREIIKKSRAAEANIPFLTRIVRKAARHAVGSGIHFRILSEDDEWNDLAQRDVEEWWNNKDVYSIDAGVDGWEAKRLAIENWLIDGEWNHSMIVTAGGWPMIQPWDVFEIETPRGLIGGQPVDLSEWDDGVRISLNERPTDFAVRVLPRNTIGYSSFDYAAIPARSMVHIGSRRRVRGHRFMPLTYSGLNKGIDALDLGSLITGTAKLHSGLAVQVKRNAKTNRKGAIGSIQKQTTSGGDEIDTAALEKVYGSMINYVGENGEIDLKSSAHPGSNLLEFYKLLMAELSLGFDLPFSVMWSLSEVGGTAVRSDMEDAQSTFDLLYDKIAWQFVRREIIWKLSVAVNSGRLRRCKDPFWFSKIVMRGPRKLTVDVGRMATAFKTLVRNGAMSIPRFLEEQGLDAYQEARDNYKFLKFLKEMYASGEVPIDWVMEATPGSQTNISVTATDPNA